MEMFVFRKRSGVMREETGGDYPDTLYVNVCVCVLCRYVNKPKLAHFGNQLRHILTCQLSHTWQKQHICSVGLLMYHFCQ